MLGETLGETLRKVTKSQVKYIEEWCLEKLSDIVPKKYLADPSKYAEAIGAIVKAEGYELEITSHISWDNNVARIQYAWKKKK